MSRSTKRSSIQAPHQRVSAARRRLTAGEASITRSRGATPGPNSNAKKMPMKTSALARGGGGGGGGGYRGDFAQPHGLPDRVPADREPALAARRRAGPGADHQGEREQRETQDVDPRRRPFEIGRAH